MITLHQKSAKTLIYNISELESSVTKAWLTIKRSIEDSDGSAIVLKSITTTYNSTNGQITNQGGIGVPAVLKFLINETDLDSVSPGVKLMVGVKVLTGGRAVLVPDSIDQVTVMPSVITATS